MSTTEQNYAEIVRERREARGWSQEQLADRAGTSQQQVGRIEAGKVKHSRALPGILQALGLDQAKALSMAAEPGDVIPGGLLVGDRGMPVFAQAEGGDGNDILNFDPVDYLKWPAILQHVKEGFGVLVIGESMHPEFKPGDIALVNPRLPPRRGKPCLLLEKEESVRTRCLIKTYESQTDGRWRVSQWNPEQQFDLSKKDWPKCFSVTGRYDGR